MFRLEKQSVTTLGRGASVLGAGGGGDVWSQELVLADAIATHGRPLVIDLETLEPDDLVLPIGLIGAPSAMLEILPGPAEVERTIRTAGSVHGRAVTALMPLEAAGANVLFPLAAAAWSGLPCVDADGMGRAFPTLSTTTFALKGNRECPVTLAGTSRHIVTLERSSGPELERMIRACVREMSLVAIVTAFAMSASRAMQSAVLGSISRCLRWGEVFFDVNVPDFASLLHDHGGSALFEGNVIDVSKNPAGSGGSLVIEHLLSPERLLRLEWRTEIVVAMEDGCAIATSPDIIALADSATGQIRLVDTVTKHTPLRVVVVPSPIQWLTRGGLAVSGPRAFGCPVDYRPFTRMV